MGVENYDIYCYDETEGIYKKNAKKIINEYTQHKTKGIVTIHQLNEIKGQVERQTHSDRDILIKENFGRLK